MPATTTAKQQYCHGCSNDYYNRPGNSQSGECWSLKSATVVTRYRIGWWTAPTEPGAFTKVTTLACHNARGQYAHRDSLPDFVRPEDVRSE